MSTTTQTVTGTVPVGLERRLSNLQPLVPLEHVDGSSDEPLERSAQYTQLRRITVLMHLTGVNFTSSACKGLIIVALPAITADLQLSPSLAFWPASVSSLATASSLLLAGSIVDVVGPRGADLFGCFASGALMLGAGASRQGTDMVAIRAISGIGLALHLSASVAIVTEVLPRGRSRNIAFSCLGLSQPLGFSCGLVIGGILVDTIGWRTGWFLYGGITLVLSTIGLWALPSDNHDRSLKGMLKSLTHKIDWVGAALASTFMALLCYLCAVLSTDVYKIHDVESIVLLCVSALAFPCFIAWMHRQVGRGKPALIPNRLWRNPSFAGVCATIVLSYSVISSLELFASLFFQKVQHLSALQASIRILPSLMVGVVLNFTMGLFVDKIPALWIVIVSSALCAGSPLLMAFAQPQQTYWANAFVAQLLQPISADALFTVGLIVVSDVFPDDTQGLAGAVFNTASQFGDALGLAIMQIISTVVTKNNEDKGEIKAALEGYRASFWAMFGVMVLCGILGAIGLRKTGRVGLKRD